MLVRHRAVPAAWPITANVAWIAAICMATATVAVSASQAEAAVELGQVAGTGISYCSPGTNTVQLSSTSETPYVVPDGGGVITRWKHVGFPDNGLPGTGAPGAGALQIWRPSGGAFEFVGRSDVMSFAPGVLNDFPTRIPVRGGDVLGLRTAAPTNGCAVWAGTAVGDNAGYDSGTDPLAGDVRTFFILPGDPGKRRLNVGATLESDADQDGFGDETQDQCASDASTQGACAADPPQTEPPQTAITKGAPHKTYKTKAKFKFRSDDPGATFECKLDKKLFRPCTSPTRVRHLDAGKHKFQVRAIDESGNVDATPAKDTFRVVGD